MDTIRINSWSGWLGSVVLAVTVGLSGCSDGTDGAVGAQGPAGPNFIVASEIPETVVATIDSATVADDGALTVNFSIEDERGNGFVGLAANQIRFTVAQLIPAGANGDGEPSKWQSYINKTEQAPTNPLKGPGTVNQSQADSETATQSGSYTDNGDGSYSYTLTANLKTAAAPALAYDASRTHRVAFQLSGGMPATNGVYDWRPDGDTANMETRDLVSKTACNSCHGELAVHGGSRVETGLCVTCHNPGSIDANSGNTVDFKVMVHKIHRGSSLPSVIGGDPYKIWGYRDGEHDWSSVVFPQDIRNCTVCHDETDIDNSTPEADNWRMVPTIEACGSCHDDVNFATGAGHGGGAQSDNARCTECHTDNVPALSISAKHLNVVTTNALLGAKLTVVPEAVRVTGADVEVDVRITLDGTTVAALLDGSGFDTAQAAQIGKYGSRAPDNGMLAINWDSGAGYQLTNQTVALNDCDAKGAGLFTCAKTGVLKNADRNIDSASASVDVISVTTVGLLVCVDEKLGTLANCSPLTPGGPPTVPQAIVPPTTVFFMGDGTPAATGAGYNKIGADIDSCRSCHSDNQFHYAASELVQCKTCHNATRDSSRTVGDLKRHVHRFHSGLDEDPLDEDDVPRDLFPNKVDNCNACHAQGQIDLPIQQNKRASIARNGLKDGGGANILVYISPTTVACGSCHIATRLGYINPGLPGYIDPALTTVDPMSAKEQEIVNHMILNGAVFAASTREAATGKEACSVCHAIGREFAVDTVHTLK